MVFKGQRSCGEQALYLMLPLLQCEIGIALLYQSVSALRRRMPSLFERAGSSLSLLVLIQMSVLAYAVGVECCSCKKNCPNLAVKFSKFHTQSCGFPKCKMFFRDFFTWHALFAQMSHVKIFYLSLLLFPNSSLPPTVYNDQEVDRAVFQNNSQSISYHPEVRAHSHKLTYKLTKQEDNFKPPTF